MSLYFTPFNLASPQPQKHGKQHLHINPALPAFFQKQKHLARGQGLINIYPPGMEGCFIISFLPWQTDAFRRIGPDCILLNRISHGDPHDGFVPATGFVVTYSICSANGGLPPMLKRRQYYEALEFAA